MTTTPTHPLPRTIAPGVGSQEADWFEEWFGEDYLRIYQHRDEEEAERAIELIAELAPTLPDGFLLGAGTLLDAATTRRAITAGAQFIVSPVFRPDVISAGHEMDVPVMPGCFTATEILNAWEAGADIVKVFPATSVGPSYLKDIRGPLPHVKLMPTGGVSIDNVGDWLKAGAVAVGVGSALLDAKAIAAGSYGVIADNARRMIANVRAARGG